jgi:hypothetical protein
VLNENKKYGLFLCNALCIVAMIFWLETANAQSFTKTATPWPDMPEIPKATLKWVGDDLRVNGLPTKILAFESEASREEVITNVTTQWGLAKKIGQNIGPVKVIGSDLTIGRPHGPFFIMVRARAVDLKKSQGTISVSQIIGVTPTLDTSNIVHPSGSKAISVVESYDLGKSNKQVLFRSGLTLSTVKDFYLRTLRNDGWTSIQTQETTRRDGAPSDGFVMIFQRENQQFDIAVSRDIELQSTMINANLIEWKN